MTPDHALKTAAIYLAASLSFLTACSVPNDTPPGLTVRLTHESVAASTPLKLSGDNLAFLADEATTGATGTDFNHDGDKLDQVPVVVNTAAATETIIAVEADSITWLNNELFMVTDEAKDGRDWSGNGNMTDLVLLHWSAQYPTAVFIDVVAPDPNPSSPTPRMISVGPNLFYSSGTPNLGGAHTSNLNFVTNVSPLTHAPVPTDDAVGPLSPSILKQDEFMIFLSLDEVAEVRDLNGDTDMTDQFVLALLDGTTSTPVIRNTKLALANNTGPFRASQTTTPNDWQIGFLVNEAAQGNTNFNTVGAGGLTASWQPTQCLGFEDTDTLDNVLFYILFANWVSDPVANPPRNTGLVGTQRVAMANGFVATISPEADDGGCDLNMNGESTDNVVRWTQMVSGTTAVLPINEPPSSLHALFDVPGVTHGLTEQQQGGTRVFVIEASEVADNLDINGDGLKTLNLLGWLLPSNNMPPPGWVFTQSASNNAFVSASWLGEQPDRSRLDTALLESVGGITLNPGGDTDTLDAVPTFGVFNGTSGIFPGVAVATQQTNAGIEAINNYGFFRVDEAADNRDWNGDGDKTDIVLMNVSFTQSVTAVMGTLVQNLNGDPIPILFQEPQNCGAFIFNESTQNSAGSGGTDVNSDGAIHPFVAYFHF